MHLIVGQTNINRLGEVTQTAKVRQKSPAGLDRARKRRKPLCFFMLRAGCQGEEEIHHQEKKKTNKHCSNAQITPLQHTHHPLRSILLFHVSLHSLFLPSFSLSLTTFLIILHPFTTPPLSPSEPSSLLSSPPFLFL